MGSRQVQDAVLDVESVSEGAALPFEHLGFACSNRKTGTSVRRRGDFLWLL